MSAPTLNQIVKQFQTIAENHKQINTFGFGDVWEIATSGTINYPMMWVSLENSSINNKVETLKFNFIFMDAVKNGEVNETEVLSDQREIAKDVIGQLQSNIYDWEFVGDGVTLEDFTERFVDSVSGWTCSISLDLPYTFNRCAMPYTQTIVPSYVCPVVTIYNSDGTINTTVASGGSYTLAAAGDASGTVNVYFEGVLISSTASSDLDAETVNISF